MHYKSNYLNLVNSKHHGSFIWALPQLFHIKIFFQMMCSILGTARLMNAFADWMALASIAANRCISLTRYSQLCYIFHTTSLPQSNTVESGRVGFVLLVNLLKNLHAHIVNKKF